MPQDVSTPAARDALRGTFEREIEPEWLPGGFTWHPKTSKEIAVELYDEGEDEEPSIYEITDRSAYEFTSEGEREAFVAGMIYAIPESDYGPWYDWERGALFTLRVLTFEECALADFMFEEGGNDMSGKVDFGHDDSAEIANAVPVVPVIVCPECGSDEVLYGEYVWRTFERHRNDEGEPVDEDGTAIAFDVDTDSVTWEATKDETLYCRNCDHEWPIPENVSTDFS